MRKVLSFILAFIILSIVININGCASTNSNIYKSGEFTVEMKYYGSCKNETCECIKKPNYICDCIDTCYKK